MALRILRGKPAVIKTGLAAGALACVVLALLFARWSFANAVASRIDRARPESKLVIDSLIAWGPSDPQTHYAAAAIFEKTFDPADLERSLKEYETAAALAPHHYQAWVNLGRSRSLLGDATGAEQAFVRALELAPNYSSVQWTYGNYLIRQGRNEEGFRLAAKAAAVNPEFARNAVGLALQIFDGDIGQVVQVLGDVEPVTVALITVLAAQDRLDDAASVWSRLSSEARTARQRKLGEDLIGKLTAGKKFRLAAAVSADLTESVTMKPQSGHLVNGGFEEAIKARGASIFDWQLGDGTEPQAGLSNSQKRTGEHGLVMVFNTADASSMRSFSQTVPVEPGAVYQLEGFYRNELKTTVAFKLEAADAATGAILASSPPMQLAGDWTTVRFSFAVPVTCDGVVIRLSHEGCTGSACRIAGRLALDDLSLRRN